MGIVLQKKSTEITNIIVMIDAVNMREIFLEIPNLKYRN